MTTFSVIALTYRPEILEKWLKSSLDSQTEDVETVFINNTNNQFDSLANAYNYGAGQATGKYYVFAHEDVRLLTDNWFVRAEEHLNKVEDLGIGGLAGIHTDGENWTDHGRNIFYHGPEPTGEETQEIISPETHGTFPREEDVLRPDDIANRNYPNVVRPWEIGNSIKEPVPVEGLDEFLTIIPASVFEKHQFDTEMSNVRGHLIAHEYAIRMNTRTKYRAYALPLPAWHRSKGGSGVNRMYIKSLRTIIRKYPELDSIYTSYGVWSTSIPKIYAKGSLLFLNHLWRHKI